jgi:hypothetical protein
MNDYETETLAKIREAMADPHVSIRLVPTFDHGTAAQVYVKSRKVSPLLFPGDGESLADVLHMLGTMAEEWAS